MAYELVKNPEGEFAVDWQVVRRIVRSYWFAVKQQEHTKEVRVSERTWNPFSWMLPEVVNLEVDWDKVRSETDSISDVEMMAYKWNANRSVTDMVRDLHRKMLQTRRLKQGFRDHMSRLQTENSRAISESVSSYETAIATSKLVRDTSFETVMILAGTMTGGAAVAAVGAGSALKGTAKWQDTDNVGAALIETSGSFIFGVIPIARKATGATETLSEKMVLVTLEASFESAGALVEGDTLGKAIAKGSVKLLAPGIGSLARSQPVIDLLSRAVVPARLGIASELLEGYAKFGFGKGAGAAIDRAFEKEKAASSSGQRGSVARSACLSHAALLRLAVVDMQKGFSLADIVCAANQM